jgi:hypothetical protein
MWSLKVGLGTTKEPTLRDVYVTLAVLPEVLSPDPEQSPKAINSQPLWQITLAT